MRVLRIIAFGVGGVVALLLIAIVAVWLLVNPNHYKDRIVHAVRTSTGRDLALPGDIKLSVFPWIALELGPATLGNPVGFPSGEFLSVQHVALRVRLLPLLHRQLQIGRIEIDQPDLHLQKNAAGKGNWQDFGQHGAGSGNDASTGGAQNASMFQSLAGVRVTRGRFTLDNLSVSDLNLDIGNIVQQSQGRYGLAQLKLAGQLQRAPGTPAIALQLTTASLDLDLQAQTLRAPSITLQLASAKLSMAVNGERIVDQPEITGTVALEPVSVRTLLPQLGMSLSATRDPQAFSRLQFMGEFRYGNQSLRLENLAAQLDDSHLQGSAALKDLTTLATDFKLTLDHIDLDRYRAPIATAAAPAAPVGKPTELPASPLKALEVQGSFKIGEAKFSGIRLTDVELNLQAHSGLIQLPALKARMYGGVYAGVVTYDVRGPLPQLQLDQRLTGVDMLPLLKDAAHSQRLSGRGNATLVLAGYGLDSDALLKSLTGHVELNLANGAIEGVDLGYEIGAAQAVLKQQLPSGNNTRRTNFDAFKMSAAVTDGIASTNDLIIGTPYLRISGAGTTNLVSKAIDLRLKATILKAPPGSPGADLSALTLAEIPVSITGTADQPKVRPDLQGLIKSQLKQKAQDLLKGKLKGLFGIH
ncbi:MAG TPA: AsmA family protein [Steroidobacteraceae bacterium]|nr:AsmA family protein [Steroidobacteraceae bacterium]